LFGKHKGHVVKEEQVVIAEAKMRVELLQEMHESMVLTEKDLKQEHAYLSHQNLFKSFKNE